MMAYFSCGVGDFIAIESFLTDKEKSGISGFFLATRAARTIEKLIRLHPVWKNLSVIIPFTEKEIFEFKTYAFFDINHFNRLTEMYPAVLRNALDYSGDVVYSQILKKERAFTKSLFDVAPLFCDIVIDAESHADDRLVKKGRNLTKKNVSDIKKRNRGKKIIEAGIKKTSLYNALAYVRGCKEFYGVDSMLASWAARQAGIKKIVVKSVNPIYIKWLPIYDPYKKITIIKSF